MKVRHKITHGWAPDHTDPAWAERVEREAEQHTARTEQAWEKTQMRLAHATARAEREERRAKPDHKKLRRLWRIVEERRQELLALQRMMESNPGGPQRHKPVPDGRAL